MLYHVSRAGQSYGPYTLADLERYLASGHIVSTDLVKSDDMAEWVALSEILRSAGPTKITIERSAVGPTAVAEPYAPDAYASNAYAQATSSTSQSVSPDMVPYSSPPNLHWGLVLLFDLLTGTLFQLVWNLIVSAWMRRIQPNSRAIFYYAAGYGLLLVFVWARIPAIVASMHHEVIQPNLAVKLLGLVAWIARLAARFSLKSSLEEHYNTVEPIGLRLNGFLVFFFGGLYIQSQLNRINDIQIAMRYRGPSY